MSSRNGRAQLLKRRERELHLRLDPDGPGDPELAPASTAYSSSAVLPTPGSPCTTNTPPRPPRAPPAAGRAPRARVAGRAAALRHARAGARHPRSMPEDALGSRTKEFRDSIARQRRTMPLHERIQSDIEAVEARAVERPARLRACPSVGARPRAQRAGLLRRPRRAEPLLGHRRHLPVGVPDHLGRRRPARRAAHHRPQHPAGRGRDRRRQRRQQQGHAPHLLPPPRRPRRRVLAVRQERRAHRARGDAQAAAARRRPGEARARGDLPGPPHASRSAASASSWPGTAPTTRRTTSSSTCPTTTR